MSKFAERGSRRFHNENRERTSRRIEGLQDDALRASAKSPSWDLVEQATRGLAAPAERHQLQAHHTELGEMAVFAFEEQSEQQRSPERLEDIESPLG